MARRKAIAPHTLERFELRLQNPFVFDGKTDWLTYTPKGNFADTVNHVDVPNLEPDWQLALSKHFAGGLDENEMAFIEHTLKQYVRQRIARLQPVTWDDLLTRLTRLKNRSGALLDELNDWTTTYNFVWERLEKSSANAGGTRLTHDDVYEAIRAGKLRAVKRGRRTIILAEDLRRWLESLPSVKPPPSTPSPTP